MYPGDSVFKAIMEDIDTSDGKKRAPKIAAEYFMLSFRSIRVLHFEKESCLKSLYFIRSHKFVQDFISIICWLYLYLTFWEPSHQFDTSISKNSSRFLTLMLVEAFIIMMFTVDYLFKVIFRYQSGKRTRFRAAFCEASFITNTICILAFIIDATVFFAVYPTPYFRFSRLFRPIKL